MKESFIDPLVSIISYTLKNKYLNLEWASSNIWVDWQLKC